MNAQRHDDWDQDERDALTGVERQLETLRRRHGTTPPLDLLRAAQAGVLPDDAQARMARHLSESAWSRALVEAAEHDEDVFTAEDRARLFARISKDARAQGATRAWTWLRPAFLVPAALALASVAWLALTVRDVPSRTPPEESTVARAEPSPAPFLLPFDKPDVRLSMAALTWRGASGDNRLLADLKPALDAYRQDDYAAARREFAALEKRYPRTIEILFYDGISSLFMNDPQSAIADLTVAETIGEPTFADDISWYRAVGEQRAGNLANARARLDAICRANRPSAARACEALARLAATGPSAQR